ncbi:MAG TPA: helix-turn-helix domain-containing protein [Candidatus Blautia intestinigallinarum]|nr:helix-turn-helix domain-containing protein [Candidatus Blautia intestinigallinarum]
MDISDFSNNLRVLRTARGYTQAYMGQKLHIQRQSYCNYENGQRTPSLEITSSIAEILGVDLNTLITAKLSPDVLTREDLAILEDYRSLSRKNQNKVRLLINQLKTSSLE